MNAPLASPTHADQSSAPSPADANPLPAVASARPARLGEELPIFCEKCGYALHGLPSCRCDHCQILHFRCPECGHAQPINTLRPAFQRMLGRLRAWCLGLWVLVKLNLIFWTLFAWSAMGYEWSYHVVQVRQQVTVVPVSGGRVTSRSATYVPRPRPIDWESMLAFGLLALPTGLVLRLFLPRWRRGYLVGLVLAGLVAAAVLVGAWFRLTEFSVNNNIKPGSPFTQDLSQLLLISICCVLLGATAAFPLWAGLVRLFLPARTAVALLEWQQAGWRRVPDLARE